ncbi:hypothetical protein R6Q57_001105 [Mikania cordata]
MASMDLATRVNLDDPKKVGKDLLDKQVTRVNTDTRNVEKVEYAGSNREALTKSLVGCCLAHGSIMGYFMDRVMVSFVDGVLVLVMVMAVRVLVWFMGRVVV